MEHILQLEHLTKVYKRAGTTAVDDVSLAIEKGHIYGLIGPNGAGKTTMMKMIAGLTAQTSGTLTLFGNSKNLDEGRNRMSFMLEAPYLDGSMTARQNMEYIRYVRGVAGKERIFEVLEMVGLADAGRKPVKQFSLGMRQRLGIGMALLPNPEIMVLDEPVNGLDPEGIVDVRNMLKKLCEEKDITILISSHLLTELSALCTDFALINRGKLVECFSAEELEEKCRSFLAIRTDDINRTAAVLEHNLRVKEYKVVENNEIRLFEYLDEVERVSKTITDSGLILTKLVMEGQNLEEYYLSKVSARENGTGTTGQGLFGGRHTKKQGRKRFSEIGSKESE
ncbi:MAG: ABC transporter ATP-binding protein [Bacteroidales bacterium]|nr:ABC transporter ATP-binding protein [Clostridium sp.]MCM1204586.1 ABC transporter ATP-binding protein [Bacteroidales bacterium]